MQRRSFLHTSSLALGALTIPGQQLLTASSRDLRFQEPWKIRKLRKNVGIFYEKGGTIAYLNSLSGIIVVDSEFPEQAGHLIGELKRQSDTPFHLLINTHHHGDHTAGNIAFKGMVGNVVAHANSSANQKRVAVMRKTEDQQLYPDTVYGDNNGSNFGDLWDFRLDMERVRAAYFGSAHTNGDSIIHFEDANIAHMGDLVFNRMWAFIDNSAGASVTNWIDVLDHAINKYDKDTLFVFGHAFDPDKVTGNKDDLRAMRDYLSRLHDFVSDWIKAGKSKDDLLKEKAIPGVTEWQGDGLANGLQATYEELTSPNRSNT